MIAPRIVERTTRIPRPRSVRNATHRRKTRAARARHAPVGRVSLIVLGILALLMSYVVLTANFTGLSYAVAKESAKREELAEATMRLDDRIAALRSDERLAQLAARLGMREPQTFAVIKLETPRVARAKPHFPVLSSLAGFFVPVVAGRP